MQRTPLKTTRVKLVDPEALEAARARVADAQAQLEELEQPTQDESGIHVHIHGSGEPPTKAKTEDKRVDALEASVTELSGTVKAIAEKLGIGKTDDESPEAKATREAAEATAKAQAVAKASQEPDPDLDPATGKTHDSAALATGYQKVLAQAEVIVPGFRIPTFDAAAKRSVTIDQMCSARKRCLDLAYATADGKALIDGISGSSETDLTKLDCAATAILFNAAATTKGALNNRSATGDSRSVPDNKADAAPKEVSIADINKLHADFWAKHQSQPA